jgi:hypothetical protein
MSQVNKEDPFWNPYLAGFMLGLVLLTSFVVMGFGLGSSSAIARAAYFMAHEVAPGATEANGYMSSYLTSGDSIFMDWMVFEVVGVFLGGLVASYSAGRLRRGVVHRGPHASVPLRFTMAVFGGAIMGFAARLGRGCTAGQALTGGASLGVGSWVFMLMVFAGGYLAAPLIRKQWR